MDFKNIMKMRSIEKISEFIAKIENELANENKLKNNQIIKSQCDKEFEVCYLCI